MPADHASGRFALLMNGLSRKAFPLGSTAALSLLISTAAHADRCVLSLESDDRAAITRDVAVPAPNSCMMLIRSADDRIARLDGASDRPACVSRASVSLDNEESPAATGLPAQQPAAR